MFSHNLTMFCSKNESSFLKGSNTSHFDSRRMICQFSVGSNSLKMFHASLNYFSLNIRSTQCLQKFGLQSLSNHFKLVLIQVNNYEIVINFFILAITWHDFQQLPINIPEFTHFVQQNNSCKFV